MKISKYRAYEFINGSKGRFFKVTFRKKDGTIRALHGRTGVKKALSTNPLTRGLKYRPDLKHLIVGYDLREQDYRAIPLDRVTRLKAERQDFAVI